MHISAVRTGAAAAAVAAVAVMGIVLAQRGGMDPEVVRLPLVVATLDTADVPEALRDLAAYCNGLADSEHPTLSLRPLRTLERMAALRPGDVGVELRLAETLTEAGDLQRALDILERVAARERDRPTGPQATQRAVVLHLARASVHLRAAALVNCTPDGDPRYCVLSGGARVTRRRHAERAVRHLEEVLKLAPADLTGRWLLNVAHMRQGTYPDAVPPAWRIAPTVFGAEESAPAFVDVARALGVAPMNLLGASIMDDFDNDGFLDLFTTSYDPCAPAILYRNAGDGTFLDRSAAAGLTYQLGGFNAVQTDYDNDGYLDVFILRGGWQFAYGRHRNSLLRNEGGVFRDVTHDAGLALPAYPTQTAAWADYDNDGFLDVYIGNEAERQDVPYPSQLFRNNGDGTFADVTRRAGVSNDRMAKGVAWGDYNNDGLPDLYVSNIGPNRLYRNNGNGTFTDVAPALGVVEPTDRSFATWWWDYDNDGWLDLYVAGYSATLADIAADYLGLPASGVRPRLYRNLKGQGFEDVTDAVGLAEVQLPMGANFGDVDNDGWLDIYLGTGDPELETIVPNVLYRNVGGRRFVDVTAAAGVGHLEKGHGIAFGDIDNDGDQDIYLQAGGFVRSDLAPNALFLNPGTPNHWITLQLIGRWTNRAAIGARLRLRVGEGRDAREIHAVVSSGGSFGASSLQQEIGLGPAARVEELEVVWPTSGRRQVFRGIAANQVVAIEEGADSVEVRQRRRVPLAHQR